MSLDGLIMVDYIAAKVADTYLYHPIYSFILLQGIQLKVGHDLIDHFTKYTALCICARANKTYSYYFQVHFM